jgi:hypothetical protein
VRRVHLPGGLLARLAELDLDDAAEAHAPADEGGCGKVAIVMAD